MTDTSYKINELNRIKSIHLAFFRHQSIKVSKISNSSSSGISTRMQVSQKILNLSSALLSKKMNLS